jgi:Sortase domain
MRSSWAATRRSRGLLGLIASAALAAGAVAGWAAWTVPATVRLLPVHPVAVRGSSSLSSRTGPAGTSARVQGPAVPVARGPIVSGAAPPPVMLAIPAAGIRAGVVPEGLGAGGTLQIPPPQQVGWYDGGPAPGQDGSTLIAGHIDDYGVPGAFLRLNAVPVGATVRVTVASGQVAVYTVTRRLLLPQSGLARSGLLSSRGRAELVLITCGGAYDTSTHLYLDNIVVVATPATQGGGAP